MGRFKIGDVVTGTNPSQCLWQKDCSIVEVVGSTYKVNCHEAWWSEEELRPLIGDIKPMGRRTFRLLKDTPDTKKGALFQERCDDGDQDYQILCEFEESHVTAPFEDGGRGVTYGRDAVENRPKWFVEVYKVNPEYMTQEELD